MKRKKKAMPEPDGQQGALVQGLNPYPDTDVEYHADQLMHHAAKRSRGYKTKRRALIAHAKRVMRVGPRGGVLDVR